MAFSIASMALGYFTVLKDRAYRSYSVMVSSVHHFIGLTKSNTSNVVFRPYGLITEAIKIQTYQKTGKLYRFQVLLKT